MNETERENLANKVASMMNSGATDDLRSALDSIQRRLDALESRSPNPPSEFPNPQSEIPDPTAAHPSRQRFTSLGEIADVILERITNQKECPYEPAGKPCDNCSMCSSRGF